MTWFSQDEIHMILKYIKLFKQLSTVWTIVKYKQINIFYKSTLNCTMNMYSFAQITSIIIRVNYL